MTKITVFGQEEKKEEKKAIELCYSLNVSNMTVIETTSEPADYKNIMLLGDSYDNRYQLIMAWNDSKPKFIYLGHWNDGVVDGIKNNGSNRESLIDTK